MDAWAIWDPFYLATRPYTESDPDFVKAVLNELGQAEKLLQSDRVGSIRLLARFTGLPEAVIERTFSHRPISSLLPISTEIVTAQQRIADLFLENRLLPKRVDVSAAVWRP